jgi:hypothetical protein
MEALMDVRVYHVGSSNPAVVPDADFHTEGDGDLIVSHGAEVIARFPAGKWSAAIKWPTPAAETR